MKKASVNRKAAVALSYQTEDMAPKVVAKGYGQMADKIIALAKAHDIFVHDAPELVGLLMQVNWDEHIPVELYQAVAEVLAFVYFVEHHMVADPT